ncbi:MAG: hypothetical protein KAT71_04305 [Gammaproteobacteria bacterium]|nr:hypothetical protein [Gammaproteobacteria bacterium]
MKEVKRQRPKPKTKSVSFSAHPPRVIFFKKPTSDTTIKEAIRKLMLSSEISKEQILKNYKVTGKDMEDFFSDKAKDCIYYAIILQKDHKALYIILPYIPKDTVEAVLREDDFNILNRLIKLSENLRKAGFRYNPDTVMENSISKLLLLQDCCPELLRDFFSKNPLPVEDRQKYPAAIRELSCSSEHSFCAV